MAESSLQIARLPTLRPCRTLRPGALDASHYRSVPELAFARFRATPDRLAARVCVGRGDSQSWQSYTWGETASHVARFARGLTALGFQRGHRLGLFGVTTPEWTHGFLAAQFLGGVAARVA